MKKLNNKGFTLVELLATMSILAVIMLLAVPNVVGIVQRNKNKTYIEDAKKLVSLAKYKIKSDSSVKDAISNNIGYDICLSLNYLDAGKELNDAPNGGTYSDVSYVKVNLKTDGKYEYRVQLLEVDKNKAYNNSTTTYSGIQETDINDIGDNNIIKQNPAPTKCKGNSNF